ncbi:hypothetical protein HD554DRAFT_2039224 [Boletus coccyginus]|nr:hypothetical protein HD554DRAFT_2039224 [Boletus coccyginus]
MFNCESPFGHTGNHSNGLSLISRLRSRIVRRCNPLKSATWWSAEGAVTDEFGTTPHSPNEPSSPFAPNFFWNLIYSQDAENGTCKCSLAKDSAVEGTQLPAQFDPNHNGYHFQAGYGVMARTGNSKFPSQLPRSSTLGLLHGTTLPRDTRLPAQFDPNHNDYHCLSKSRQYQYALTKARSTSTTIFIQLHACSCWWTRTPSLRWCQNDPRPCDLKMGIRNQANFQKESGVNVWALYACSVGGGFHVRIRVCPPPELEEIHRQHPGTLETDRNAFGRDPDTSPKAGKKHPV